MNMVKVESKENFSTVTNGGYFIAWDCGADLSADTIEAKWRITGETPCAC